MVYRFYLFSLEPATLFDTGSVQYNYSKRVSIEVFYFCRFNARVAALHSYKYFVSHVLVVPLAFSLRLKRRFIPRTSLRVRSFLLHVELVSVGIYGLPEGEDHNSYR